MPLEGVPKHKLGPKGGLSLEDGTPLPIPIEESKERNIADIHDDLFAKGIFTKSMIKSWIRCPQAFEQRYVYGRREKPGFALQYGSLGHWMMEEWGKAELEKLPLIEEELHQQLHDRWVREEIRAPKDTTRDEKINKLMTLYRSWRMKWRSFGLGEIEGIEVPLGYDGDIEFGGVPVAGHPDILFENVCGDYKIVKSNSSYRKGVEHNLLEMGFYAALAGKKENFLFPMIHDFKTNRKSPVEKHGGTLTADQMHIAEDMVAKVADAIKKGVFPATHVIDQYPCTKMWCGFYGSCPHTKGRSPRGV